ncbi:hypothetical protein KPSA3_02983 [Pseudomonas syringae pv. actinidiae]|uniref:Uncharacterized protein n=1 Tax=Pseudomonas syringae pv. actinidiae TaxID=103796 RepID=A0AAN4TKW2_PSESF|nr:hypothetical protein KPSA3_02983 [Pseudomonas syringae pv. actinidiae]
MLIMAMISSPSGNRADAIVWGLSDISVVRPDVSEVRVSST